MTASARVSAPVPTRKQDDGGINMAPLETINSPTMARLEGGAFDEGEPASKRPSSLSQLQPTHQVETLAWRNLSYYYKIKGAKGAKDRERAAVKQSTGVVRRGDMVAVMGECTQTV